MDVELERREGRTHFVDHQRVIGHLPRAACATPFAHPRHEGMHLDFAGYFPVLEDFRMRFWTFSYSIADPCGRSFQFTRYFIISSLSGDRESPERHCSSLLQKEVDVTTGKAVNLSDI